MQGGGQDTASGRQCFSEICVGVRGDAASPTNSEKLYSRIQKSETQRVMGLGV